MIKSSTRNAYLYFPLPKTELFNSIERDYGLKLIDDLGELEEANFWVKNPDDPLGMKFRPWLDEKDFRFLVHYGMIFNEAFKQNNREFDPGIRKLLDGSTELKAMFEGINRVNHPKTDYRPYVLDMVLKDEKIDLVNGLKNRACPKVS